MRKALLALLLFASSFAHAELRAVASGSGSTYNPAAVAITGGSISGISPPIPVASGGTGVSTSTGSGSVVLSTSPTLVTPALGIPSSLTLTNATGLPVAGLTGLGTGVATALGAAATGSGGIVLSTSPVLTTPNIGAATASSITNTGLTANSFVYSGAGGLESSTAAPTNGQLLIGSTGAAPVAATLTGTANQISITNGAGSITASIPSTLAIPGTVTSVNGYTTAGNGVGVIVAKYDTGTAQSANVPTTTVLYSVPSNGGGAYWLRPYVVETQAATTSSTLPQVQCTYTDADTNTTVNAFMGATSTTNTVGTLTQSSGSTMHPKVSTNITCGTSGYASAGATVMQFMAHWVLFYAN